MPIISPMMDFDLPAAESSLLVVDVQERFLNAIPAIAGDAPCGLALQQLVRGAGLLDVPVTFSEQVPDKLGTTLPDLLGSASDPVVLSKSHFSVVDDADLRAHLAERDRGWIVVAGIEAHVCVFASACDLQRHGYRVIVADDAIASRRPEHADAARAQMRAAGIPVLPVETILFRWQRQAGVGAFRELSRLVR